MDDFSMNEATIYMDFNYLGKEGRWNMASFYLYSLYGLTSRLYNWRLRGLNNRLHLWNQLNLTKNE